MKINPEDYKEPQILPKGQYECEVVSAEEKSYENEKGNGTYIRMGIRVIDTTVDNAQMFNHSLRFPGGDQSTKYAQICLRECLDFCKATQYDLAANDNEINPELLRGLTFFANLDIKTGNDGVQRNEIKKFVVKK